MTKMMKAMDLGCLDLGCLDVDKKRDEKVVESETKGDVDAVSESSFSSSSSSKLGKNKSPKSTSPSALNALNRVTSQIKKPPHRKSSPLNWFPRKKVDSYLKRKIKLLQEGSGMNLTLDETLGDANPHYCRVLKEKMAAREAANKAMEARKAALVEASWCRILQAARIQIKEAELVLSEAEKKAGEAFESAAAVGVIMYDIPNSAPAACQVDTSSNGGGSATHAVTASFETAFEVDRQVAAAVKIAFTRLTNCPSFDKDEVKELLRKISENPDTGDTAQELSEELSSECESESGLETRTAPEYNDDFQDLDSNSSDMIRIKQKKSKRSQSLEKFNTENLVEMMLERLKHLKEEELSSLATIVATCGLNAALAEVENTKPPDPNTAAGYYHPPSALNVPRRVSCVGGGARKSNLQSFMDGPARIEQVDSELPSLDKFLVKRMTKLEREVQEARSKRNESGAAAIVTDKVNDHSMSSSQTMPLESILLKHSSKFEKEIEEAKKNSVEPKKMLGLSSQKKDDTPRLPSLDKFLVKRVSRLEREVEEAKNRRNQQDGKENVDTRNLTNPPQESLDKILLIKPVHRLEREKMQALSSVSDDGGRRHQLKQGGGTGAADCESLDRVLVKHVSRLEKEKTAYAASEESVKVVKRVNKEVVPQTDEASGGLDQILVKHKSRLERAKMAGVQEESNRPKLSVLRRQERERELQEAWGGLSFGNSIRPHVSKLEQDKLGSKQKRKKEGGGREDVK